MSILRQPPGSTPNGSQRWPLRVFASGTLFVTHRLSVSSYPAAGGVARAQNVQKTRGGHGVNVLSVLAQFRSVRAQWSPTAGSAGTAFGGGGATCVGDVQFSGPLSGNEEGAMVMKELDAQGIGTLFSIVRDGKGIPTAWVIEAGDGTKTVINHNPILDMTHDEFVSRLGPVLAPENYDIPSSPPLPAVPASAPAPHTHARKRSGSGHQVYGSPPSSAVQSPYRPYVIPGMPPFDWMHFEGRAPQTTLANMNGLNGLARERGWRSRCVFSLHVARTGVEALIPHADVVFFPKSYAQSVSPSASPRSFLISMSAHAAPHALLVVDWGAQGAALLSVPTREYLQSSGWIEPPCDPAHLGWGQDHPGAGSVADGGAVRSVRSGSGFWADGRPRSGLTLTGSEGSQCNAGNDGGSRGGGGGVAEERSPGRGGSGGSARMTLDLEGNGGESDSRRTSLETERGAGTGEMRVVDAAGAYEAFVAGMVFALSQRVLPGRPYVPEEMRGRGPPVVVGMQMQMQMQTPSPVSPGAGGGTGGGTSVGGEGADVLPGGSAGGVGRWKLEECLRFATELSGRKGRRQGFEGLRLEMEKAGWVVE